GHRRIAHAPSGGDCPSGRQQGADRRGIGGQHLDAESIPEERLAAYHQARDRRRARRPKTTLTQDGPQRWHLRCHPSFLAMELAEPSFSATATSTASWRGVRSPVFIPLVKIWPTA